MGSPTGQADESGGIILALGAEAFCRAILRRSRPNAARRPASGSRALGRSCSRALSGLRRVRPTRRGQAAAAPALPATVVPAGGGAPSVWRRWLGVGSSGRPAHQTRGRRPAHLPDTGTRDKDGPHTGPARCGGRAVDGLAGTRDEDTELGFGSGAAPTAGCRRLDPPLGVPARRWLSPTPPRPLRVDEAGCGAATRRVARPAGSAAAQRRPNGGRRSTSCAAESRRLKRGAAGETVWWQTNRKNQNSVHEEWRDGLWLARQVRRVVGWARQQTGQDKAPRVSRSNSPLV